MKYEGSSSVPAATELLDLRAGLEAAFVRLGALAGAAPGSVAAALAGFSPGADEREAFEAALPRVAPLLRQKSLDKLMGGSLLSRYVRGVLFEGETDPEPKYYPAAARKALEQGDVVASSDADLWLMVPQKGGAVQVCHAHPESFEIVTESITEWLTREADSAEAKRAAPKKGAKKNAGSSGETGKPAIDASLVRLAALSGSEVTELAEKLAAVEFKRADSRWRYFKAALAASGAPWSAAVRSALEGRLLGRCLSGALHDGDEACEVEPGSTDLEGINPVYIARYPKEARKPMKEVRPSHFVASSGPEVWFILMGDGATSSARNISVHHAAYDGYEVIAERLEDWLRSECELVERVLAATSIRE